MKLVSYCRKTAFFTLLVTSLLIISCNAANSAADAQGNVKNVKYVFFFIGDGMGPAQIHVTEAYLASLKEGYNDSIPGMEKFVKLSFTQFPVMGMITTYADDRLITDSAAAGTALSCGMKTACGVVGMSTDKKKPYTNIAELAKAKGMKIGIVTSQPIDDATPSVFYAHEVSRDNYYAIGVQLANSNFDYFAGGSLRQPTRRMRRGSGNTENKNTYDVAKENGYKVVTSREELNNCRPGEKIIAYDRDEDSDHSLPYEIDRPDNCLSLAELTEKGIELLDNDKGFFMMIEGGKIDHACHADDAVTSIVDTIALDKAVLEALDFYKKHPDETLIIITADHETGGMTLGYSLTEYSSSYEILKNQKMSYEGFDNKIWPKYRSGQWSGVEDNIPENLKTDINDSFGLVYDRLSAYQKKLLEDAYDKAMASAKRMPINIHEFPDQDKLLYSDKNPVSVTLTCILDNKAGIGWTTFAHTAVPVEVHAIGADSDLFSGFYDNTDIPKKIAKAIKVELKN